MRNRLESPTPLGYSLAGVVEEVDPANTRFRVGDRVSCTGAECAFHAEYVAIPDLLAARVPEGVENWQAAYTALCSIAMQAVRQTEPGLGERVMVMGQGLVGLLVTNLLVAAGARVMAVDVQPSRRPFAAAMGAERIVIASEQNLSNEIRSWTDGYGVDAVIVCTATQSNTPIEQAAEALRDRGRIVDVGITKIELPWKIFYEKEIEVRFSRSYGPGRYDSGYEWGGNDYPIGYVRWTEQRNFEACLHLMAEGKLKLGALTTLYAPFGEALKVYDELMKDASRHVGVVLEYGAFRDGKPEPKIPLVESKPKAASKISKPVTSVDVIGAGNFARTMLLPHLAGKLMFGTVVNQTALSANHVKTKFAFRNAATDARGLLKSGEPNAVLIATRHHLHAPLVIDALRANRHVFVEKPLCLTRDELNEIDEAVRESSGSVQVGFNRRFAPATVALRSYLSKLPGPKTISYRVMAGKLDPNHWYANYGESGGRVIGEACHFFDYFCFLLGNPVRVLAQTTWPAGGRLAFPDSVAAQIVFADGSSAQLIYSAEGDPKAPKESVTVFGAGFTAEIKNFLELTIFSGRKESRSSFNSKGHGEQMQAWSGFLAGEIEHPLPYPSARAGMLLTFAVLESIQRGSSVSLTPDEKSGEKTQTSVAASMNPP